MAKDILIWTARRRRMEHGGRLSHLVLVSSCLCNLMPPKHAQAGVGRDSFKVWNSLSPVTEHVACHISNIYLGGASVCACATCGPASQPAIRSVASRSDAF